MSASGRIALKPALDPELLKALRPAWVPAGILAATAMLAWLVPLPAALVGLRSAGPYALLGIGAGARLVVQPRPRLRARRLAARRVRRLRMFYRPRRCTPRSTVLVPLNVLLAMLRPERGARYRAATCWLALLGAGGAAPRVDRTDLAAGCR